MAESTQLVLLLLAYCCSLQLAHCSVMYAFYEMETEWPGGFASSVTFPADRKFFYGWVIYILFDTPISDFKVGSALRLCLGRACLYFASL